MQANFQSFPSYSLESVTQSCVQSITKGKGGGARVIGRKGKASRAWNGSHISFNINSVLQTFNSDSHLPYCVIQAGSYYNFYPQNVSVCISSPLGL